MTVIKQRLALERQNSNGKISAMLRSIRIQYKLA